MLKLAQILATRASVVWKWARAIKVPSAGALRAFGLASKAKIGRAFIAAKHLATWSNVKSAGLVLGREAAIWGIMSAIFNHEEGEMTSELEAAQAEFMAALKNNGIDMSDYASLEDLATKAPLGPFLRAVLDSGMYAPLREFFRAASFTTRDMNEAEMIAAIRNTSDEMVRAAMSEPKSGDLDGVSLSSAIAGTQALRAQLERLDFVVGVLGLSSRAHALKLIELFREDGGIDTELGLIPNLEQF